MGKLTKEKNTQSSESGQISSNPKLPLTHLWLFQKAMFLHFHSYTVSSLERWNVGTCDTSVAEACLEIRLPQGPVALAGLRARFAVHQHCHSGRLEVTVGAAVGDATIRTWG